MIALVGNFSRDHVPGRPPLAGGGVYHGARALARLRVPARIVARCAETDRDELVPQLARFGTPVRYVPGTSTATFSFSYDGDHRTMEIEALGDAWAPDDLPQLPPFRWVHVAALSRHEFPAATLAALARNRRVSLDGQGLVRAPEVGPLRLDNDFDPDVLRHVWVLKLAEDEAEVIGDPTALGVRELLITQGSRGSTVHWGARSEFVRAHPISADPTGAGDAFSVAYVVARNAGFAPPGAARRATAVVAAMLADR
jgi:sugar/nucleoside kinase (ribokinase family)